MTDLSAILNTAGIATATQAITGDAGSSATAAGYSAWVTSITGRPPTVVNLGNGTAQLTLDEEQQLSMRQWFSAQVGGLLSKGEPDKLDIGIGPVIGPWALQYATPLIIGAVVLGWMAHWFTTKK
jgi:hypothetical protein